MDYSSLKAEIKKLEAELIQWRRDIHQYPELGLQERRTSKKILALLKEWGYEVATPLETGVVGLLRCGGESGQLKTIAIRADIDALPLQEENDFSYCSQNEGVMHACGHDAHTAIALGAAKILAEHKEELKGNIKFIFQPAEEGPGGAEPLVAQGVMADVDLILGLHVNMDLPSGSFGLKSGAMMASPDEFKIIVKGRGGHGAHPEQGVDPIVIGAHLVLALQEIVTREIPATESVVLTCGTFHAGTKNNIIPAEAEIRGTVRTLQEDIRKQMKSKIERTSKGIAHSFGADVELEYQFNYPPLINDEQALDFVRGILGEMLPEEKIVELQAPSMGGEDFAYYLQKAPGAFVYLGTYKPEIGADQPLHSSRFKLDESILTTGVEFFCRSVFEFLK